MIDDYFEGIPRARKAYLSGDWNECLAIQEENHRAMEAQWHEERVKPQAVTRRQKPEPHEVSMTGTAMNDSAAQGSC